MSPSHLLVVGASADDRLGVAGVHVPATHHAFHVDTRTLPFVRAGSLSLPPAPRALLLPDVHLAFPDAQTGGTRLVLTQSTYLLQKWIDRLDEGDVIVATADRAALEQCAAEFRHARGPWRAFEIVDGGSELEARGFEPSPQSPAPSPIANLLARAFAASDPIERLRLCREAVARDPACEVSCLALASTLRENRDGGGAREALDRAATLAPDWEAIHYESGKLSLVFDDLQRARDAFQRAADLMPSFSAAYTNLGATLGELDEPAAALKAFRQALAHDPNSFTILNNIGVVCRELGRLDESDAALRRVIAINPGFVFGHYNLGHTLFLAGRYREALGAYEEGRRRDPQENRRQGCRLAVVRFASGDAAGAERDLWRCVAGAAPEEREDLLLEAYEVAHAVLTRHPELEPHRPFLERISAEIVKPE